jgi:5-methylthioadenosine/S-adenosylhomocysteine deaminase
LNDRAEHAVRADWVIPMDPRGAGSPGSDEVIVDGMVIYDGPWITAVGPAAELSERHRGASVTHLRGHALLPGFVNAHTHLAMTMFRGVADDVCLEDFLATVLPLESRVLNTETVHQASLAAMVESHLAGVTTALDMYFFADSVMAASQQSGFRVVCGPVVLDGPGPDSNGTDAAQRAALGEAWLGNHPVEPDWRAAVGPHSTYLASPGTLDTAGALASGADALLHIHAAETADEVELVQRTRGSRPVALLDELGILGNRTVIAHGVHLDQSEVETLAGSGASIVHCPASNLKLASGVAPVKQLLDAGVNVALGTDGPASSNDLDMLGSVRLAALLHKTAAPGGPDATAISAREALRMATVNGAVALGLEGRLGILASGAMADMSAIDLRGVHAQPVHDVFSAIVYAAGRGDITDVWSRGVRVVDRRAHRIVDESEVAGSLASLGEMVQQVMGSGLPSS